ncbi:NAD(P)H-dependent oxidoreductase [Gordonia otitidis]|uniref:CE1759 family FMN reductase n=1 Tax=Gordonia otitidis TaxID=249058 RepID=UPI001D143046|nr:CE1759 family FMN reductase [Gordonia otitidis]UEA58102.1 NAD(P)H-dependent oxidoreductase [Gordonia otitidis]
MNSVTLVAVNAGLSEPSSTRMLVDRLTDDAVAVLQSHGLSVDVRVIDLRDLAVDVGRSLATGFAGGAAGDAVRAVQDADALIVATPVFNASYSGLFKSFFDLVDVDTMAGKPVLIAATGGSPRHSMVLDHALRPLFSYLRTVVVPTGVYAASEDWAGTSGDTATLTDRIHRAATQLAALLTVGSGARAATPQTSEPDHAEQRAHADEEAGIANFARLLAGD